MQDETTLLDHVSGDESDAEELPKDDTPPPPCLRKRGWMTLRYALVALALILNVLLVVAAVYRIAVDRPCAPELEWWKKAIIYQVYPRSFQDSNGDGIGDLNGIASRLDYFRYVNASVIWLNPIYASPMKDNGYDVANYTNVDPIFGNLSQFDSLLAMAHDRDVRVILDFVPNHSSNLHPWFVESRRNRTNSKRDWYVWADPDPLTRGPPNNWQSVFGGSAWTYDVTTGQYYLHQFLREQPDLNYSNPHVVEAMNDVLRFWLDRGVDGFRVDAFAFLFEDPLLRNETVHGDLSWANMTHTYTQNLPGVHDIVRGWRAVVDEYSDRFIMGEVYGDIDVVASYYGTSGDEFDFPFNFLLIENQNWTGIGFNGTVRKWMDAMPEDGWPNWVIGNHDNHRVATRFGVEKMKTIYLVMMMLPGTVTSYYGEEIAMRDVDVPKTQRHDVAGRDAERTPMQWNGSALNAGFSLTESPWLPLAPDYASVNVATEKENSTSMLRMYRQLAELKANHSALRGDSYYPIYADLDLFVFLRGEYYKEDDRHFLIVSNLCETKEATFNLRQFDRLESFAETGTIAASTSMTNIGSSIDLSRMNVLPYEALVIALN
ncbi:alpha-glucosidase-like [Oscarella lobularis]|uniref:alpha-glucosidase-like n=1 Tax=Oscarella lobularis TaxID=121494 RepID=UPI0033133097